MAKRSQTPDQVSPATVEIRNYPASLIYDHTSSDGSIFRSLSFRFKEAGREAWASLVLPTGSVSQSVTRNGQPIEGRLNISLGNPDDVQNVSVQQEDNSYKRTPMFNRTIIAAIAESRQEYLRRVAI